MTYRKKVTVLSGIAAALAVVLILAFIFDPERIGSRSDAYSWLQPRDSQRISRITIAGMDEEAIELVREDAVWYVSQNGKNHPARRLRVEDFISTLTRRASYPVRSTSAASHMRLSLVDGMAARISVADSSGQSLLDLLVGHGDVTGQNVYLRRQGHNEVRSGEDIFSVYLRGSLVSWFDFRLFPETEIGLDASDVQRLTVVSPAKDEEDSVPSEMVFTRSGRGWVFNFDLANPDFRNVENYIRDILYTLGDSFIYDISHDDPMFDDSRIQLEFGNGSTRTILLSPAEEDGRRYAVISGSDLVYSLPPWASLRLFAEPELFERL